VSNYSKTLKKGWSIAETPYPIRPGGWAKYGHIPALQALKGEFEIVAVASRKKATAEEYAAQFNLRHAFGDERALINCTDVDLVVILAPAPEHPRLAKAAIAAGKDVYSEWPLTTKTSDSEELVALAESKGVRHIVGLQRRLGPSARYMRDLVKQGYVGEMPPFFVGGRRFFYIWTDQLDALFLNFLNFAVRAK
jgi:predicted dehydrogenase